MIFRHFRLLSCSRGLSEEGKRSCLCGQVRSDWFVYVVLSCLPWVGKELYEKKDVEMDRLLSQIEGYLK